MGRRNTRPLLYIYLDCTRIQGIEYVEQMILVSTVFCISDAFVIFVG